MIIMKAKQSETEFQVIFQNPKPQKTLNKKGAETSALGINYFRATWHGSCTTG